MRFGSVLFVLGNLLILFGCTQIVCLGVAALYDSHSPYESTELIAFVSTACVGLGFGAVARYGFRDHAQNVGAREGFAIVTFSWLLMTLVGMIPYLVSGVTQSVTDAFFETMSGFTTTGATIFPEVELLPHGIQFWRCMTQWLGGMGIVVLSVALLPTLGLGGYRLLVAESPGGVTYRRDSPRIVDSAKAMWKLYLWISVIQTVLLVSFGLTPYNAICHAFTTMSTGGFSPHTTSVAHYNSAAVQWTMIFFMFVAGTNFSIHSYLLQRKFLRLIRNPEFCGYCFILLSVTALGLVVISGDSGLEKHIRDVTFQVVSIGTTTGYATVNYETWPEVMRFMLVLLMFVGGCMGSTAGGMKVTRLIVFGKTIARELHRLVYPHAMRPLRVGRRVLEPHVGLNILAFGSLFALSFVVGIAVLVAYDYDLVTASSASVAALGNIGPGLAKVGPTANWSHIPAPAKWVLSFLMLLGRLEMFSVLMLFTPWVWKK